MNNGILKKGCRFLGLIVFVLFGVLFLAQEDVHARELKEVLGVSRSEKIDRLILKNGDKLSGKVLIKEFTLTTSYAKDWKIKVELIAGIHISGDTVEIHTMNRNRFSE